MDKKDILIVGKGYIGERLHEEWGCPVTDKRINSYQDAEAVYDEYKPKVVINGIGATGASNVDDCEKEIDKTLNANVFVPTILAELAMRKGFKLVHLSSGCIYDYDYSANQPPIAEDHPAKFFGLFYSRTKIYAEQTLMTYPDQLNCVIARIRIPMDNRPHRKNIINKLVRYKRVIDLPNSVTYIPDFVRSLEHLIETDARGIFNTVNKGGLRYPKLLDIYQKYYPDFEYSVISLDELNLVRTNLIMSTDKLEASGFPVRNIDDVLEECVKGYHAEDEKEKAVR